MGHFYLCVHDCIVCCMGVHAVSQDGADLHTKYEVLSCNSGAVGDTRHLVFESAALAFGRHGMQA